MSRPNSGRLTTHDLKKYSIDARDWCRRGMLKPHADTTEVYYHGQVRGFSDAVVGLEWTRCTFGGYRGWFVCPRCERRVAILYHPDFLACRHCYRLTFRSQRENEHGRDFLRLNKLRVRLGWPGGVMHGEYPKPKGMHHRTFLRLRMTYLKLAYVALLGMGRKMAATDAVIQATTAKFRQGRLSL